MTIAELLKAKGIDEETIKTIQDEMKANKLFIASEENLDIRYGKLKTDHDALVSKHAESEKLISDLQKSQKDNQAVQDEITGYKAKIDELNKKLADEIADHALDVAVQAAGVDEKYRKFIKAEIRENKDGFEIDDNGEIKGISDKIAGLKIQFPALFTADKTKDIIPNKLPDQNNDDRKPEPKTLADALKAADEEQNK